MRQIAFTCPRNCAAGVYMLTHLTSWPREGDDGQSVPHVCSCSLLSSLGSDIGDELIRLNRLRRFASDRSLVIGRLLMQSPLDTTGDGEIGSDIRLYTSLLRSLWPLKSIHRPHYLPEDC